MVFGTGAAQSTEPKSQLRPRLVNRFQTVPSRVQPAEPSREKLASRAGEFWSTVVAQPVSSRPEMTLLSTCCQTLLLSERRQSPKPTTLMVTSPLARFTTTPEQPPGHAALAPLLVNRCNKGLEISVHDSAAWNGVFSSATTPKTISANPRRTAKGEGEKIICTWLV